MCLILTPLLDCFTLHVKKKSVYEKQQPVPLAAWSTEWVWGRLLAGIAGWNPAGGTEVCLL